MKIIEIVLLIADGDAVEVVNIIYLAYILGQSIVSNSLFLSLYDSMPLGV